MLLKTMFCPFTMDYGPDADTAQIAQTLSKTISKALMLIKYHVFNYLGQILVFILFPNVVLVKLDLEIFIPYFILI